MTKGKPDLQYYSQKGYDAEITALDILEKLGYEILQAPEKSKREFEEKRKVLHDSEISKKWNKVSDKHLKLRKKHNAPSDNHTQNISDSVRRIMKKATDEFYKINKVYSKELDKVYEGYLDPKIDKLINKILGKSILPKSSGMGKEYSIEGIDERYFSEPWNIKFRDKNKKTLEKDKKIPYVLFGTPEKIPSKISKNVMIDKAIRIIRPTIKEIKKEKINYSKKKGYYEIYDGFMKLASTMYFHPFIDVFCKKGNDYYVFDIKQKTYKENKNLNKFHVTNYEVLNYNRITKKIIDDPIQKFLPPRKYNK